VVLDKVIEKKIIELFRENRAASSTTKIPTQKHKLIPAESSRSNKKKYTEFISGMPTLSVNEKNKKMHVCDKLSDRRDNLSYQARKPITDSPILPVDEEHEKEQHQQENGHTSDKILNPLSMTSAADCDVESSPSPLNPPTGPSSPSSTLPSRPITATSTTKATSDSPIRRRNMIRSARKNNRDYSDNKEDDKIEQMLVEYNNEVQINNRNNQTQPKQQDGKMYKEGDVNVEDDEEEDHDEYNSGRWSVKEHTRVVEAFSKFGRTSPKIQPYVETRSIRGIETYIIRHYENVLRDSKKYKFFAEDNNVEEEDGPSDNVEDDDEEEDEDHDNNNDNENENENKNENEYNSGLWSVKEHKRLVEAFSKLGRTPSKLQPYIKTRSIEGIKMYINRHYENVLRDIKKYKNRAKSNTGEDEPSSPANASSFVSASASSTAAAAAAAAATNKNRHRQMATSPKKRKLQSTTNNKNNKKTRQNSSSSPSSSSSSSLSSSITNGPSLLSDEKKTLPVANDEPTIKQEVEKESKVSMHESETTTSEPITNAHLVSSKEKQGKKQRNTEKETESDKTISATNDEQESKTTTDEKSRTIKHETKEESTQDPKQEVKDESTNNDAGDDPEIEVIYIDMSDEESTRDNSEAAKESEIKSERLNDDDDDDGPQIIDVDIIDVSMGGDDRVSSISKYETAFSTTRSRSATAIRILRGTHEVTLPPLSVRKCTNGSDVLKSAARQSVLDKSYLFIFENDVKKDIGNEKKVVRYEFRGQNPTSAQFKLFPMDDILQGNANDDTVLITMSINEVDDVAGEVTLDACCF
jgi:hypothetical protein